MRLQTDTVIVGTFVHLGEFAGTKSLIGCKGLRITLEPIELLQGPPARFFTHGRAVLAAIDWQVLDERLVPRPERNQKSRKRRGGR